VRCILCGFLCTLALFFTLRGLGATDSGEISFFADETEVFFREGCIVKRYDGNVTVAYKDMILTADKAVYYETEKKVELVGNVCVRDTSKTIEADSITYLVEEKKVVANGHVLIQRKGQRLSSDRAVYLKVGNQIIASGGVQLIDPTEQITVTGGQAEYDLETKVAVITDHPKLIKGEMKRGKNIIVTARQLEFHSEDKKVIASQDVHINKERMNAICGQMTYLQAEERLILQNTPEVIGLRSGAAEEILKGDTIEIAIKDGQVNEVIVIGEATGKTVGVDGGEVSQVSGQKVSLQFKDEELQRIAVEGNATSIYRFFRAEDSQREINEVSGDTVQFFFRDGELYRVLVTGRAMGIYSSSSMF